MVLFQYLTKSRPEYTEPDMATSYGPSHFLKFNKGASQTAFENLNSLSHITFKAHSPNAGIVQLNSADPYDVPYINFNYFSGQQGEEDIRDISNHIRMLREQAHIKLLVGFDETVPGAHITTDENLADWVRKYVGFGLYACCTTKIGTDNDPMAVLDGKLRVRGVKNLRVVSASSFPAIPG
ncbi:uncharacterized protein VTP21DRAFT_9622 [Calcarisporiella thermophila]|uniref:uncharacterized protein n=1 Tax=Calcarisporiella thermophila TaxID=911321 RepID=UPI003743F7B0